MIRRVIAAVVAIILAAVAALLVLNYAAQADDRALADMETDNVYVAAGPIPEGTGAEQLAALVETKAVPRQFQVEGRITDLDDLDGRVAVADIAVGEQLRVGRFATPDELRARGEFALPEEAENLHQVTIPLENPRALGGSIAPGDLVGVFGSFEVKTDGKYGVDEDGNVVRVTAPSDGEDSDASSDESGDSSEGDTVDMTDLLLHKVLVVRVEGGYVAPPPAAQEGEEEVSPEEAGPADVINVTLALGAEDAGRVVFAQEFGTVWLSLEPEGADDEETPTIIVSVPDRARNVLE